MKIAFYSVFNSFKFNKKTTRSPLKISPSFINFNLLSFLFIFLSIVFLNFDIHAANTDNVSVASTTSTDLSATQAAINNIKTSITSLASFKEPAPPMTPNLEKLITEAQACQNTVEKVQNMCAEWLSPVLLELTPQISLIGGAISAAVGIKEKCEQANKGFQILEGGLAAYHALCSSALLSCKSACNKVSKSTEASLASLSKINTQEYNSKIPLQSALTQSKPFYDEAKVRCEEFAGKHLASALLLGAKTITNLAKSKDCANETTAGGENLCVKSPQDPSCVDCTKSDYQSNIICICAQNPRAPGCEGLSQEQRTAVNQQKASGDFTTPGSNPQGLSNLSGNSYVPQESSTTSLAGPTPGFGNTGGGLGNSKGPSQGTDGTAVKSKGLNTQVLGGDSGGGGGGGRGYSSGGGLNPYDQYLPQSEKTNPNSRSVASVKDQITGAHGLSNWEKVKRRYIENKSSLLNK